MTEDEAKTRWCPFTRVAQEGRAVGHYNRILRRDGESQIPYSTRCIASTCMAWRWQDEIERRWTALEPDGEGWQRVEAVGGVAHWARTHRTPHGYCGLAGAPR